MMWVPTRERMPMLMPMVPECECRKVMVGWHATASREWDPLCPLHGVGTEYFRAMRELPYGFQGERRTSRAAYLKFVAEDREAEVPGWDE